MWVVCENCMVCEFSFGFWSGEVSVVCEFLCVVSVVWEFVCAHRRFWAVF